MGDKIFAISCRQARLVIPDGVLQLGSMEIGMYFVFIILSSPHFPFILMVISALFFVALIYAMYGSQFV